MSEPGRAALVAPPKMTAIRSWIAHGTRCALVRAPLGGAINGYVKVPRSFTTDMASQVEVHGGITYHGDEWVGFDTLHSGDVWPGSDPRMGMGGTPWDRHWTEELAAQEAERLAAEVKRVMEQ